MKIDVRKIQQTGGSSYIVTLPKGWIKRMGLQKNDAVQILERPDGTLVLRPENASVRVGNGMRVFEEGDYGVSLQFLYRSLIGAYIAGYREIKIRSEGSLLPSTRGVVSDFVRTAIGLEIMEETDREILIRDILKPEEVPLSKIIRRMYIIVYDMFKEALNAIEARSSDSMRKIVERDVDVDRLHWLVARRQNMLWWNADISEDTQREMNYFNISKVLERIGDHVVNIALNSMKITDKMSVVHVRAILTAGHASLEMLESGFGALTSRDVQRAHHTIESLKKIDVLSRGISTQALKTKDIEMAINLSYIAESIKRTAEYTSDLCEYVIDYFI